MRNVVFIPSQLLTADLWAPQLAALAGKAKARVADHTRADTVGGIAQSILDDSPQNFVLVAHGMGGFIAFEIMRRVPERVEKLMLFSTLAAADQPAQTERRMGYLRLVETGNFAGVVEERIPMLVAPDRREDHALLAVIRKMAADTGPENFLRQQRAIMARPDSRPGLSQIKCPTLLVFGRHDGIGNIGHQQDMLTAIPGCQLEVIEDSGHLVPLERPERANGLLLEWLGV